MRDLKTILEVPAAATLVAKNRTADENGAGVDLQGFEGAVFLINVGAEGDVPSGTLFADYEAEESTDDVTYTDVANADLINESGENAGTMVRIDAAAEAPKSYLVGYIGTKRYVRCVYNITGTHTTGTPASVDVIKGFPRKAPTAA